MAEIRRSPRPGVQVYTKPISMRVSEEEGKLLEQLTAKDALNTSASEVFRFLLREYGPAHLPKNSDGGQE